MLISKETLLKGLMDFGIAIDDVIIQKFDKYAEYLVEYNNKVNLTAITDSQGITIRHFIDSLSVLYSVDLPQGARVIDVGTGAGFPGVPLKIVRPDIRLTLLDSSNKKLTFLKELSELLSFEAEFIHVRAEEGAHLPSFRENFDAVTARAVASLPILCEYCLPFLKQKGVFVAMKGPDIDNEAEEANGAIKILGGQIEEIKRLTLPDDSHRTLILIRKISQTPPKYPRNSSKISKSPL